MKKSNQFRAFLFAIALASGLMVSCKNKEATVEESATETTTTEMDTTAVPAPETMPADTTTTPMPATTPPAK
ncbi:MAG TPA: hypothetical protein VK528_02525 [Flavobacterium sp.]|nr:hypothetical protein [Flavobacterium sp.]